MSPRTPFRAVARAAALSATAGTALVVASAITSTTVTGTALAATAHGAHAAAGYRFGDQQAAVFVQTDNTAGNAVVVYRRSADGALQQAGTYPTDGNGGILTGSVVDHLASQGSLALDRPAGLLVAVNAGSNTISVFGVRGDRLQLRQVLPSGGSFPVSVAVHGDIMYVLNAENGGQVQGYRVGFDGVIPLPGSARPLGLNPAATPQFTTTPGQVAFTPDGRQLMVTTKANGNDVDVFGVLRSGYLTAAPAVNNEPGSVPFAVAFDPARHVVIAEAGPNALATFSLSPAGTLTQLASAATGQAATCWVTAAGHMLFASNAGSATVSEFTAVSLTLLGQTSTDPGTVDSAVSPGGHYLYVQTGGNGIVDEFAIGSAGTLTPLGSVTVPGAVGGEGIVAS